MKRDDLVELILNYPEDTEFFVEGWGGRPGRNIYASLTVEASYTRALSKSLGSNQAI